MYMKLYSLSQGVMSWAVCLKLAWANDKERISKEEIREVEKQAMKSALAQPTERSSYDDLSIPQSVYYNPYSYGHFGAHYVGD